MHSLIMLQTLVLLVMKKIVPNIAASITYGTGIRLGTESATEKVGSSNYKFKEWKDKVLQDESLRNVILSDQPRKR